MATLIYYIHLGETRAEAFLPMRKTQNAEMNSYIFKKKEYQLLKVRNLYKLYIKNKQKKNHILSSKNKVLSKALTMKKSKNTEIFYMSYNTGHH